MNRSETFSVFFLYFTTSGPSLGTIFMDQTVHADIKNRNIHCGPHPGSEREPRSLSVAAGENQLLPCTLSTVKFSETATAKQAKL